MPRWQRLVKRCTRRLRGNAVDATVEVKAIWRMPCPRHERALSERNSPRVPSPGRFSDRGGVSIGIV
jgi:hypothetical protein